LCLSFIAHEEFKGICASSEDTVTDDFKLLEDFTGCPI